MLIGMMAKFLMVDASLTLKIITVLFPVVDHSFIPPDRVFAQIEKNVRKVQYAFNRPGLHQNLKKACHCYSIGDDCPVVDLKNAIFGVVKT